jgi:predicted aldo/keto reductase-like oxidoreductase
MRYIPQSKYSFDDICKQCYDAINRPSNVTIKRITVSYNDVLKSDQWDKEFATLVW